MDAKAYANDSAPANATQATSTASAEPQDPPKENEMNDIDDTARRLRVDLFDIPTKETPDDDDDDQATS